jgi:hypothetical protein
MCSVDVDVKLASSYCLFNLVSIAADGPHSIASHSPGMSIYVTTIVRKTLLGAATRLLLLLVFRDFDNASEILSLTFPVRASDPLTFFPFGYCI